jgi:asparagine N-glycosylation enzyme membrane subunit Stt3
MLALLPTLFALDLNSPFPVTLGFGAAAIVAFGSQLVIATRRVHLRKGVYVLLACCVALGVVLAAGSGYFTLAAPSSAAPNSLHQSTTATYYDLYVIVWKANVIICFVLSGLMLVTGKLLSRPGR